MKNESGKFAIIIALSIAMLGATIAVAIPNLAEAAGVVWCNATDCFKGKAQCVNANNGDCHKTRLYTP